MICIEKLPDLLTKERGVEEVLKKLGRVGGLNSDQMTLSDLDLEARPLANVLVPVLKYRNECVKFPHISSFDSTIARVIVEAVQEAVLEEDESRTLVKLIDIGQFMLVYLPWRDRTSVGKMVRLSAVSVATQIGKLLGGQNLRQLKLECQGGGVYKRLMEILAIPTVIELDKRLSENYGLILSYLGVFRDEDFFNDYCQARDRVKFEISGWWR